MMTPSEIARFYYIIHIFLSYGLDELIPQSRVAAPLRLMCGMMFWVKNRHLDKSLGERLRLALQSLGPVWIKFGQMLSTRRDLLPAEIVDQISMLQDRVAPFSGNVAQAQIEKALGRSLDYWFTDFDTTPLATASIAQVHTATLKENGKQIVLKVIRPGIFNEIQADMKLMYRLAGWLPMLLADGRRLRPQEVVQEYHQTLLDELNLMREAANAIQIRRNFDQSEMLYVPEIYTDLCRENVLVMERIYGISIADITQLRETGINMKLLAERGVQIFFTQVFRDSFFHADMHPGNIFVSYQHPHDPQYIAIDFGIVGSLNRADKRYLAENFLAFFNRDYRRVAELHVDSGWVPPDTNVRELEFAMRTVCEPIFEKSLDEISFGHVLLNLFNTARRFNMEVQPQLVLLQKTLLYIEGLGRQLYPQLDLWVTAKPFLETWLKEQVGLPAAIRGIKENAPFWAEKLPELPGLVYNHLVSGQKLFNQVESMHNQLVNQRRTNHRSFYLLGIGAVLALSAVLLLLSQVTFWPGGLAAAALVMWFIGWRQMI